MNKQSVRNRIEEIGIIPGIRVSSAEDALFAAEAVASSGIPIVEVTMTVPGAIDVIAELTRSYKDLMVGAGTVLDVETARRCLESAAVFLTTPGLDLEIVDFAAKKGIVLFPGVLSASEIMAAWNAGADFVKIFPGSAVGGASYIKALKAPFPKIPLIASGGVNQHTAADFIRAGAIALGIGRDLIQPRAIERRERGWIRELASRYLEMVREARGLEVS
jgi:2-dehydro-3-deoxyphosphogluconate aldolase/(4S)-4-hydroxy-2-oxoglutarate aldolase